MPSLSCLLPAFSSSTPRPAVFWEHLGGQYSAQRLNLLAARSFQFAAECYRDGVNPQYEEGVRCYKKAARSYRQLIPPEQSKAAEMLEEAASCASKVQGGPQEIPEGLYCKAARLYSLANPSAYACASKSFQRASEIALLSEEPDKAILYLDQAVDMMIREVEKVSDIWGRIECARSLAALAKRLRGLHAAASAAKSSERAAEIYICLSFIEAYQSAEARRKVLERAQKLFQRAAQHYEESFNWLQAIFCYERCLRNISELYPKRFAMQETARYDQLIEDCWAFVLCYFLYPPSTVTQNPLSALKEHKPKILWLLDLMPRMPQAKRQPFLDILRALGRNARRSAEAVTAIANLCIPLALPEEMKEIARFLHTLDPYLCDLASEVAPLVNMLLRLPLQDRKELCQMIGALDSKWTQNAQFLEALLTIAISVPLGLIGQILSRAEGERGGEEWISYLAAAFEEEQGELAQLSLSLSVLLQPGELSLITDILDSLQKVPQQERARRAERILEFWDFLEDISVPISDMLLRPLSDFLIDSGCVTVDRDALEYPQSVLLGLRNAGCLLGGNLPEQIRYFGKEAVDAGGVTRDIVTELFKRLYGAQNYPLPTQVEKEGVIPLWQDPAELTGSKRTEQIRCYEAIGMFFSFALQNLREILIGPYFHPLLFQMLYSLSEQDMEQIEEIFPDWEANKKKYPNAYDQLLLSFFKNHSSKCAFGNTAEERDENIDRFIKQGILPPFLQNEEVADSRSFLESLFVHQIVCATLCIARGIYLYLGEEDWETIKGGSAGELAILIQGVISKKGILASLKWERPSLRTQIFLTKWVQESSEEQRRDFLQAVTGSCSLLPLQELSITPYSENEKLPTFQSCVSGMHLPNAYPNYKTFKIKMEQAISCIKDGFQVK